MTDLIQREMVFAASPGEVWAALTDPHWLSSWVTDADELELHDQDPTPSGSNPYAGPDDRFRGMAPDQLLPAFPWNELHVVGPSWNRE